MTCDDENGDDSEDDDNGDNNDDDDNDGDNIDDDDDIDVDDDDDEIDDDLCLFLISEIDLGTQCCSSVWKHFFYAGTYYT